MSRPWKVLDTVSALMLLPVSIICIYTYGWVLPDAESTCAARVDSAATACVPKAIWWDAWNKGWDMGYDHTMFRECDSLNTLLINSIITATADSILNALGMDTAYWPERFGPFGDTTVDTLFYNDDTTIECDHLADPEVDHE